MTRHGCEVLDPVRVRGSIVLAALIWSGLGWTMASGQFWSPPAASPGSATPASAPMPSPVPPAQLPSTAMTSKDYLKLMAEVEEARAMQTGANVPAQSAANPPAAGWPENWSVPQTTSNPSRVAPAPTISMPDTMPARAPIAMPPPSNVPSASVGSGVLPPSAGLGIPPTTSAQSFVNTAVDSVPPTTISNGSGQLEYTGMPESVPRATSMSTADVPHVMVGAEAIWLRREGDRSTSYSQGGELGSFGEDFSGLVRVAWYWNPMERTEFAFMGPLEWNRFQGSPGPVDSLLQAGANEPNWLDAFQGALGHQQTFLARLRSYELNRRWITDDLSNCYFGFHAMDYEESYALISQGIHDNTGQLQLDTRNLLAGVQGGMELWRPISQRIAIGGQSSMGLYGNFADRSMGVSSTSGPTLSSQDDAFQIAASVRFDAKLRYQLTSRVQFFGAYSWWYLGGLATVDDQSVPLLQSNATLSTSTDAGFLLQGVTLGTEMVF